MSVSQFAHAQRQERHANLIGAALLDVPTPALLVDAAALERNVARMGERFAALPSALRPHIKVHKCPEIARRQIAAGAIGVATATVREAVVMAEAGIDDVLVANQVVGSTKIAALFGVRADVRMTVAVDDPVNVAALSDAARKADRELGVLVELDIGQRRCGVRDGDSALRLAEQVADAPGLRLRGMQGYEGHCMLEPDHDVRARMAQEAIGGLVDAVDLPRAPRARSLHTAARRAAADKAPDCVTKSQGSGRHIRADGRPRGCRQRREHNQLRGDC